MGPREDHAFVLSLAKLVTSPNCVYPKSSPTLPPPAAGSARSSDTRGPIIRNSKNIFLFIRNFDRLFKRGINLFFYFLIRGNMVFPPLRYGNAF
ncbi:MAG: hypothetical protein A3C10_00570 [Candidatus Magasanikbacteria bacterium RIFCSPHIGHO2_02_FULL_48_18]|nr:MAG: hypothetical protein A3C10_00570 [Candidatus Magasanikbacteria bacterium RIFCSPHIGHO2_02_FULL_48_18]